MLIKDLKEDYPLVYGAALENCDLSCNENYYLDEAFCWNITPEGSKFWETIDNENFEKAKEICPHLFEDIIPDYVECINVNNLTDAWTKGKIYKIEYKSLYPKTLSLISDNGVYHEVVFWDESYLGKGNSCFKPYTKEAYETHKLSKPKSKPKSTNLSHYVGRYLKALVDYPDGGIVQKGEYGLIKSYSHVDFISQKDYLCSRALLNPDKYELMPEGFTPDTEIKHNFKVSKISQSDTKSDEVDMKEIQRQCKEKYPISCTYKCACYGTECTLKSDYTTYNIVDKQIYAHHGGGILYQDGKFAEIVRESVKAKPKPNYKGKVVHVDTQEKWDFVTENLEYDWTMGNWDSYGINTFICLSRKEYGPISLAAKDKYQIISFDEYLSLNLLHEEWESYFSGLYSKPDEWKWDKEDRFKGPEFYQKDKFMEPIKVKPYKKSKSKIKLIF